MKKIFKLLLLLTTIVLAFSSLFACDGSNSSSSSGGGNTDVPVEEVDYVSQLTLDLNSETAKQKATVKLYIDGDTTHFNVPESVASGGVLKARYLAINTPESTGKVEEYGKTASNFTKEKLMSATSIIIESDDENWNVDSTGSRYLVWIWYRTSETAPYRNLNLEILQNGLAIASSTANNRYGEICMQALNQAKTLKKNVFSGKKDPNFYYGSAIELTLKELRCNVADYEGMKVAFEGVVTRFYNQGAYLENYDEETEIYYGMYVYLGASATGSVLEKFVIGNKLRVVGTVGEFQGSYQVSGVTCDDFEPGPNDTQIISEGNVPAYTLTTAKDFIGKKTLEFEVASEDDPEETTLVTKEYDYAELVLSTSISMKNLTVSSVYTTESDTSSDGAMTLTCYVDGIKISVRTLVLRDENNDKITEDAYKGKTIDVKGVVDYYNGSYQIKVLTAADITVHD